MIKRKSLTSFVRYLTKEFSDLEIRSDVRFKDVTTFKIGGRIKAFIEIKEVGKLLKIVSLAKKYEIPYFILGFGSNILASDKTFNGLVIKICLTDYCVRKDKIICGAGVGLFKLNYIAIDNSLSGLEWSFGIPGSVGGAVRMNAGSFGGEIKDVVECVYYTDGIKIYKKHKDALKFGYRTSYFAGNNDIILKVVFKLNSSNAKNIRTMCFNNLKKRKESQPYSLPSAGSIFKRPKDNFAPVLIENCKLKGLKCGGAQISKKHCGFIVNYDGKATFKQVFYLITKIKKTVLKKFDIILKEEIIILR